MLQDTIKQNIKLLIMHILALSHCSYLQCESYTEAQLQAKAVKLFNAIAYDQDLEAIKEVIKDGANVNTPEPSSGWPALHTAIMRNLDINVIETLLQAGAKVNLQDRDGFTPMHYLAQADWLESNIVAPIVKSLLDHGADITIKNNNEKTVIQEAKDSNNINFLNILPAEKIHDAEKHLADELHKAIANNKDLETIEKIIASGADINAPDDIGGWSALHTAIANERDIKVINALLQNGAKVNLQDNDGNTPMHHLADIPSPYKSEIIRALLDHGADITIKNNDGKTAIDNAISVNDVDFLKYLFPLKPDREFEMDSGEQTHYLSLIKTIDPELFLTFDKAQTLGQPKIQRYIFHPDGAQIQSIGIRSISNVSIVIGSNVLFYPEEEQLFALAHEIGHYRLGHVGNSTSPQHNRKSSEKDKFMFKTAYSRQQEIEADEYAVKKLKNVDGGIAYLERILKNENEKLPLLERTHPFAQSRIEHLEGMRDYVERLKLYEKLAKPLLKQHEGLQK